jgi:hypothetical protein
MIAITKVFQVVPGILGAAVILYGCDTQSDGPSVAEYATMDALNDVVRWAVNLQATFAAMFDGTEE